MRPRRGGSSGIKGVFVATARAVPESQPADSNTVQFDFGSGSSSSGIGDHAASDGVSVGGGRDEDGGGGGCMRACASSDTGIVSLSDGGGAGGGDDGGGVDDGGGDGGRARGENAEDGFCGSTRSRPNYWYARGASGPAAANGRVKLNAGGHVHHLCDRRL